MATLKNMTRVGADVRQIARLLQAKAPENHMLAYITPEEAQLLKDRGGSGMPDPQTGIPSFQEEFTYDMYGEQATAQPYVPQYETNTPVFLIGHITKDGNIAGPKILEHMVDTVLQFEGDRNYTYRILRTLKNRFGSTAELGIYEMTGSGMRAVSNPSELLISQKDEQLSGIAIAATMEGQRPLLIEGQALVTQSVYGTPQRTVTGFDLRRLQLLLAVLEKRGGFHFGIKDVFVNIAGGLKVEDPSLDLAIVTALLSSYEDVAINPKYCFAGEVGLSGEIRAVNRIEQRIAEAEKLGFEKIIVSKYNIKSLANLKYGIEVVPLAKVEELYQYLF